MAAKVSLDRIGEIMHAVLTELQKAGGEARAKDLMDRAEPKLKLTAYELEPLESSGILRWRSLVSWYSVDTVKAGFIRKGGGKWTLTEQGGEVLRKSPAEFIRLAQEKYRAWAKARAVNRESAPEIDDTEAEKVLRQSSYDQALEQASSEIEDHINRLDPYDFQKLVAELLIGMGYHVPFVASPGPDGGIDLVAYKDPLGTSTPRLRVQVKHREQKVSVKEVRELEGLLRKDGDMGLMVSSGGFTADAEREIRSSTRHIETMTMERLISLWQQYYDTIREPGKSLLPLVKLFFLAPTEE